MATAETVAPAADLGDVVRIVALNSYCRKGDWISESWGTSYFKTTFKAAYDLCSDEVDSTTGFNISWHPTKDFISCTKHGILDDKLKFYRELPLTGALAEALIADLEPLAMDRAVADLKAEEELAFRVRAKARLDMMLKASVSARLIMER